MAYEGAVVYCTTVLISDFERSDQLIAFLQPS